MTKDKEKQYIYIVQASLEPSKCKIGKTNDLERRLKEYNNMTGKSKENIYQYLFTCEVKDMAQVENPPNGSVLVNRKIIQCSGSGSIVCCLTQFRIFRRQRH